jgi:hypothetical protein
MSHEYECRFYRTTNHSCVEDAEKHGMVTNWETTYGYSTTMDAFTNAINLLGNYDPSLINEYAFIWTIDGVEFPAIHYAISIDLLDASANYFETEKKDFFLNLNKKNQMQIKATTIHAIIERMTEISHPIHGRLYVVEHLSKDNESFYRRIQNWQTDDLTVDICEKDRQEIFDFVAKHHNTPYAYSR